MPQDAAVRPEPNYQRKAAIAYAGGRDHAGSVDVRPIQDFDLNRTIFQTLDGRLSRFVTSARIGKEVEWHKDAANKVQSDYEAATADLELPEVSEDLMKFLVDECDFDVEHADGSFLDHLYFCFEYTAKYYPHGSPLVMLLHSVLGTGTNTFAMEAEKIPKLEALLEPSDFKQIAAFPSVLRLLYLADFGEELRSNADRQLESISMRRVIDNAPLELTGDEFWEAMNYQLIHLVDFLPPANWQAHYSDPTYIRFRDLYDLMERAGKIDATVKFRGPAGGGDGLAGEKASLGSWIATKIPVGVTEKMAESSIRKFSEACGHSLEYKMTWV